MKKTRLDGLDIFRGWALLFMVLYHFSYDLNHFQIISININHSLSFLISRYSIISMFLLSVGISLALVHQQGICWESVQKRIFILGLASLVVTLTTYIEFPTSWIYFGILHFILFSSLLALPFLNYPKITFISAVIILIGSMTNVLQVHGVFAFLQPILNLPPLSSEDVIPLTPWFALVLLGINSVQYNLHQKILTHPFFNTNFAWNKSLKFIGQHSLLIYLLHQPLLFFAFDVFFSFFSKV